MIASEIIIIDSYILTSFPEILELKSKYYRLVTTSHVIQDIKSPYNLIISNQRRKMVIQKITEAQENDFLIIYNLDLENMLSELHSENKKFFSTSEISILDLARSLKKDNVVNIASLNLNFQKILKYENIKLLRLNDILDIYSRTKNVKKEELNFKLYYERKELITLANKIFMGFLVLIIISLGYYFREKIIINLKAGTTIISSIIISILLYLLREKQRIIYGIIEFGVGLLSVILIFYPLFNINDIRLNLSFGIRYLGGLYIMIRGIDNIVNGLSKTKTGQILKYKYGIGINNRK